MTKEERTLYVIGEYIYNANWKESLRNKYPPCWIDVSKEVRAHVYNQARAIMNNISEIHAMCESSNAAR